MSACSRHLTKEKELEQEQRKPARYINPKELSENGVTGDLFSGTYLATYKNDRVSKDGRAFVSVQHLFKTPEGEAIYVNGSGLLNWIIENRTNQGDLVTVSYKGRDEKGHKFDVRPIK